MLHTQSVCRRLGQGGMKDETHDLFGTMNSNEITLFFAQTGNYSRLAFFARRGGGRGPQPGGQRGPGCGVGYGRAESRQRQAWCALSATRCK